MAAIKGQPAPKPSSVGEPVPGAAEEDKLNSFLASFDAPDLETPEAQGEVDPVQGFVSSFDDPGSAPAPEEVAPVQAQPEIPADQFEQEPGFVDANINQFRDFTDRLKAGLAANDKQKIEYLRGKYGSDNVTTKEGAIYFRKDGKGKFRRLDPEAFEIVNDLIGDFSRDIVTEAAMLPGEALGAVAAGPGGAVAGRVASVPFANEAADKVAEYAGIPDDPNRSKLVENAVGMGAEAVLPVVGRKLIRLLPGTAAYKAAKEAGEREVIALSKQSNEVAKAIDELSQQGKAVRINGELVGVPEADVSLMGHQLNPDNPVLQKFANVAASDPRYINAQKQLAEDWGESAINTLQEIARKNHPGPYRPEELASKVTNAVSDIQKAEGQAIGKFKAKAMAKLKNARQPLPAETNQKIGAMMQEYGFKIQAQGDKLKVIPPSDLSKYVGTGGLTSVGEVRAVVNSLKNLSEGMTKGLRVGDLERLRNSSGDLGNSLFRTRAGAQLSSLSGDLRREYRNVIAKGLDDDFERKAFETSMDTFSLYRKNVETLKRALNEESSAKAIVKNFFTGKENLQKIKAIKQISPESFDALKEEWVNQLMIDYASRKNATGLKSSQFLDALNKKYGDEFLTEVIGKDGKDLKNLKNVLTVTERLDQTFKKVDVDKMSEEQKRGIMDTFVGLLADIKFKTVNGIAALLRGGKGRDHVLHKIMTRDGIDKYVASYPGKIDKKGIAEKLNKILAENKFYKAVEEAGAKAEVPRAIRAGTKGELQEGAAN